MRARLFAGVEKLIDQVLFDANIAREHELYEAVGEVMLLVKHFEHLTLLNDEDRGGRYGGRGSHADRLPSQTTLTKEVAGPQNGHDRLFADLIDDGEFHTAVLQVQYAFCGVTLRVDDLRLFKLRDFSCHTSRVEKSLGIEGKLALEFFVGFNGAWPRECSHANHRLDLRIAD